MLNGYLLWISKFFFRISFSEKKKMKYSAFFTFFIFIRKIKKYNKTPMITFFNKL